MKVKQIHEIMNAVTSEVLGKTEVIKEDLSNIVDVGKEIMNTENMDNYVKKLVNHIGKVVFVNRVYSGSVPSVMMDSWEFGSVLQKVSADLPEATENATWNLKDKETYNQDIFYQPKVSAKFFNSKVTFEIPMSFTEKQVKESFSSAEQLNGFLSMLTTSIENSMTVKLDSLIMRTINNMMAETLAHDLDVGGVFTPTGTGSRAVNLLSLFNATQKTKITKENALINPEFIRFATYTIGLFCDRMSKISTIFNIGAKERFTPKDLQHVVLLSDFALASETYLISDTFNADKVALPTHETVPYWQGSGESYDFADVSKINVKTTNENEIELSHILGVVFDRDAVGVSNLDRRVTTNYNAKAEFYTNFYKFDAGYYNDMSENFVVFFMA